MKNIPAFKIDKWSQEYGPQSQVAIYGSNVRVLSLDELSKLDPESTSPVIDPHLDLTYGTIRGSVALRERIAALHSSPSVTLTAENVLITPGSVMANYLTLTSLCGPGDHVICQYPTFAQLYEIPRYQGAEVSLWRMRREDSWVPQLEDLKKLIRTNTKVIIMNNPANPTGTVLPATTLYQIIELAEKHNITLYSDEVFRPLFHTSETSPPPFASLGYKKSVTTGSLSKAQGLPGIRLGWAVSQDLDLLERVLTARDYTTISVSVIDDSVATFALSPKVLPRIMERNLAICQRSLKLYHDFVRANEKRCDWVSPRGGGTAFLRIFDTEGKPVNSQEFGKKLVKAGSLCVMPGTCFSDGEDSEMEGWFRVTLGDDFKVGKALAILQDFLQTHF